MRDYVSIGSSPYEEECVQVSNTGDYIGPMKAECQRFMELIRKKLGLEPEGARLALKGSPHDFGTYYEVVCYYEDTNEEATKYAYRCESEAPAKWDDDKPLTDAVVPVAVVTGEVKNDH